MATNFPTSLDSLTNPTASDKLNSVTVPHASQHADINDAVEALEAKVGVDGSSVVTSHDYLIDKQSVVPYDDASARTTAVPSPVEGQMSYLKDTNSVEVYDGSAWVGVGGVNYGTATGGTSSTITVGGESYTMLTFTSSGTLTVTDAGIFDYLIVGSGGGGGNGSPYHGGGGGAGGYVTGTAYLDANATIVIAAGGSANRSGFASGINVIVGTGGGAGAYNGQHADSGGSGGGGVRNNASEVRGGTGDGISGNDGGDGRNAPDGAGGGGGGAGAAGTDASSNTGGDGGNGLDASAFRGEAATTTYYAGGGGGAGASPGTGGLGGGGDAQSVTGDAGSANTGGGGGAGQTTGGAGGSGIVLVRFKN